MRSKSIFIVLTLILLLSISYDVYFYFKPMNDIEKQKTDFLVSENQFINDFNVSPENAHVRYKDKIIEISGHLKKTEIQEGANNVIFDQAGASIIVASFKITERKNVLKLVPGNLLRLKGIYKGFIKGDDLFGTPTEIKIDQCTILK